MFRSTRRSRRTSSAAASSRCASSSAQQQGEAFDAARSRALDNKRAVLDQLIDEALLALAAERDGVVVSDALVRKTIAGDPGVPGRRQVRPEQLPAGARRAGHDAARSSSSWCATACSSAGAREHRRQRLRHGDAELDRLLQAEASRPATCASSKCRRRRADTAPPTRRRDQGLVRRPCRAVPQRPRTVTIEYVEFDGADDAGRPPRRRSDAARALRAGEERVSARSRAAPGLAHPGAASTEGADAAAQKAAAQARPRSSPRRRGAGRRFRRARHAPTPTTSVPRPPAATWAGSSKGVIGDAVRRARCSRCSRPGQRPGATTDRLARDPVPRARARAAPSLRGSARRAGGASRPSASASASSTTVSGKPGRRDLRESDVAGAGRAGTEAAGAAHRPVRARQRRRASPRLPQVRKAAFADAQIRIERQVSDPIEIAPEPQW